MIIVTWHGHVQPDGEIGHAAADRYTADMFTHALLLLALCQLPDSITLPPSAVERDAIAALASATGWAQEVTMPDGSRADLIGPEHAAEVEWATNWKESIGQAVLYAILADRRPAVVLLVRGDERVEVLRCRLVCERIGVRMWVVRVR